MKIRNQEGVKGALYIRCSKCGNEVSLYAKEPKEYFKCKVCGNVETLRDLRKLDAKCECGKFSRYLTNIKEELFDFTCRECGNLIALEWNRHKDKYKNC